MNAQVNSATERKERLDAAIAAVLAAQEASASAGKDATGKRQSTAAALRALAVTIHETGANIATAVEYAKNAMKARKVPTGTVDSYAKATKGYAIELANGKDLEAYKIKDNGEAVPMTVREAHRVVDRDGMTEEEAKHAEAVDAVKAEIRKRMNACGDLATLEAARDALPEISEAETAAERKVREAREAAKRLAGGLFAEQPAAEQVRQAA